MKLAIQKIGMVAGFGAALFACATMGAFAQQVENLGSERFWTAWKGADSNGVICYISSQPQDAQPTNVNRDPIHFLVVHRDGLGTKNEIQVLVGYPLDADTKPEITIGDRAFDMLVDGSTAWGIPSDEGSIVSAMKAGSTMVVKGRSQRGTNTVDTYSLSGVTAAMAKIDAACG